MASAATRGDTSTARQYGPWQVPAFKKILTRVFLKATVVPTVCVKDSGLMSMLKKSTAAESSVSDAATATPLALVRFAADRWWERSFLLITFFLVGA